MIEIRIATKPHGKGRARAYLNDKGSIAHVTPKRTRQYESLIRTEAMIAMGSRKPVDCPVAIDLQLYYAVPKSWPRWKRDLALNGKIAPTVKPDADNVLKAFKDAMNGVVWVDDTQVILCVVSKSYALVGCSVAKVRTTGHYRAGITKKEYDVF